jgi:putative membrane protein
VARHSLDSLLGWAVVGVVLSLPMLAGLVLAQRLGLLRLLDKIADKVMPEAWRQANQSSGIHDAIVALYRHRRRFFIATAIHLAAWLVATAQTWVALGLIGRPLELVDVITLESIIYAVRNAAFLVPGALGIQEGAYVVVGALFGLPAEAALAISLIKRGRELTLGLPALLTWQMLGRKSRGNSAS